MGDLIALGFPFAEATAEVREGLPEEGGDEVGLQAARLGAFHVRPDLPHPGRIHGIARQRAFLQKLPAALPFRHIIHRGQQSRPDFRAVAVADGVDQELA
jgi:hypothetical protein